jgi:hypothetical protein
MTSVWVVVLLFVAVVCWMFVFEDPTQFDMFDLQYLIA